MTRLNNLLPLTAALALLAVLAGCIEETPNPDNGKGVGWDGVTLTDSRDKQTYRTVTMGNLSWMAENLNYAAEGSFACEGVNCGEAYGRFYTWDAAMSACPAEWRLPTSEDWGYLEQYVGGNYRAGGKLKSQTGWKEDIVNQQGGNGTDEYGFSALPVGYLREDGVYNGEDSSYAHWWTATESSDVGEAVTKWVSFYNGTLWGSRGKKELGFSVRCVRGDIGKPFTVSFNTNGGIPGAIADIVVENVTWLGESKFPANPTMAGYAFAGWFDGERVYDENTPIFKSVTLVAAWKKLDDREDGDALIDPRDSQSYRTVIIGGRQWMAENLNYETTDSSWCYEDDDANCAVYGRLYTYSAAMVACPAGWHLPGSWAEGDDEWVDLIRTAGGYAVGGTPLKSETGWSRDGNGTDDFGFSATPGGYRDAHSSHFYSIGETGFWWSKNESGPWVLSYRTAEAGAMRLAHGRDPNMYSVRCVKD